jgi:hypothetical protein
MGLMYSHVDGKSEAEWDAIETRVRTIRERAASESL